MSSENSKGKSSIDMPLSSPEKDSNSDDENVKNLAGASSLSGPGVISVESIRKFLSEKLSFHSETDDVDSGEKIIEDLSVEGLIKHWKEQGFKKIVTMVGAGISTSAGIPDFRSPGSGLYDNLEKYDLPHPQAIFELSYFRNNPKPFFVLAKELYPGTFKPTASHYFSKMLHQKGLLLRHYTQNIDTLERIAGIPDDKLVEAHGTFYTNHCLGCRKLYTMEWMKEQIFSDVVPTCTDCNSVVKPDIVFFGEDLPDKFYQCPMIDFDDCDLLIIMGTSLEVQPFASLIERPGNNCIRLLINREKVGRKSRVLGSWFMQGSGLTYNMSNNKRDIAFLGDCDDGVFALANGLGWGDELRNLIKTEHAKLEENGSKTEHDFKKESDTNK